MPTPKNAAFKLKHAHYKKLSRMVRRYDAVPEKTFVTGDGAGYSVHKDGSIRLEQEAGHVYNQPTATTMAQIGALLKGSLERMTGKRGRAAVA